ncbi:MAG TPA: M81 family metallopeptidase, partial [Spirillospora sp.]|nr:M81 family metallopeptidase [Spirillospora sp.]
MRIGTGGIMIECCTFSPLLTQLEYFRILRGEAMLPNYPFLAQFPQHDFIPTLHARSIPGGSVEPGAYQQIKAQFLERLQAALPLDGLFLHLHGAMHVQGMDDAEGDWISAAREVVGPDCLISASFDLHGNISRRMVRTLDMLTTYRTAPHVDTLETQERALRMLVRALETGTRPQMAWIPVPVALPGEKTSTEWEPGKSLYAMLPEVDAVPGVWDASMFVGYAWADEPRAHATIVVTGTDRAVIEREAKKLAQAYWDKRAEFQFGSRAGSIDECIEWALAAPEKSVFISDSGDNPTAGGCDDVPIFLERLLAKRVPDAVVASIADAQAVAVCYEAGVGAKVSVSLGGKL